MSPMASVDVVEVDGLLVTSFARTIVDLATVSSAMSGVAGADYALHRKRSGHLSKDQLLAEWEAAKPLKAHARSLRILEFATHLADSPAESAGRVNMYLAGFPEPRLQTPFFDIDGFIGEPDYDFEGYDHLGEVDGKFKYFKPEYLRGHEPGEVIYEEKSARTGSRPLPRGHTLGLGGLHQHPEDASPPAARRPAHRRPASPVATLSIRAPQVHSLPAVQRRMRPGGADTAGGCGLRRVCGVLSQGLCDRCLGHAEAAAEADRRHLARVHHAVDRHLRDAHHVGDLCDRQKAHIGQV